MADEALRTRIATIAGFREHPQAGQLMSYGVSMPGNYRRAAVFIDKLLSGANAAELPFEFPTKLELVVNLNTARTVGISIPESLLATADEVLE